MKEQDYLNVGNLKAVLGAESILRSLVGFDKVNKKRYLDAIWLLHEIKTDLFKLIEIDDEYVGLNYKDGE